MIRQSAHLAFFATLLSCTVVTPTLLNETGATAEPSAHPKRLELLRAAADAFYEAQTPEQLRAAVASATDIAPRAALRCELAARLALLEGDEARASQHLMVALQDTGDDAAVLHLHQLMTLEHTYQQRADVKSLLKTLHEDHPDPEVRALAAYHLSSYFNADDELEARDAVVASIPGQLQFSLIGTWDNDSGKAFDAELGPESRPGFDQTYEGRSGPLHWRRDAPLDPRGRYDLAALMAPVRWSAAFAQAIVSTEKAGPYELFLTTTDPVKVWLDGKVVFSGSQLERSAFDHLKVPLELTEGDHRLLIKSAHRDGSWLLSARLVSARSPRALATTGAPMHVLGIDEVLDAATAAWPTAHARTAALRTQLAHVIAGGTFTVKSADAAAKIWPKSLTARMSQIDALWFNQERGRTADLLQNLDAQVGDSLDFVRLRQLRFQQQQGQKQKARDRLLELKKMKPSLREANELLAETWRTEGWAQDELNVQNELKEKFGSNPEEDDARARTLIRLGRRAEAIAVYERVLEAMPREPNALRRIAELSLEAGDLAAAQAYLSQRLESWPTDVASWVQLADVYRRQNQRPKALSALARAARLSPYSATAPQREGDLAYEANQVPQALTAWRRALELDPDNESLANRIDFLSPEARGPWLADVPDEAAIERAVKMRSTLVQTPGADVAWLLDHEITLLNSDGSSSNVVTEVVHAFNPQGRDRVMRQTIPGGRLRVMASYSIDERGVRSEASGERSRQIFFRGMQPGSTLVLQYRLDKPPQGYLSRYLTQSWQFQSTSEQRLEATYILWAPLGVTLNEERVGLVSRTQEKRGEQVRVAWSAKDMPPLVAEPAMPTAQELAANLRLSTVPDWPTWLSWERALLDGAFRDSPELDAVAKTLNEGAADETERLKRIHQFVMEEIRYQQDYETFIAGVKPHPAPMVLERRYGDCKDKAVLFIELAKKLGIEAHFALVRTRDAGPVMRDVPMQQFNHAIVYVPEQKGVASGRFFDPTAELLDVDSVRTDDVATQSVVLDVNKGSFAWREIPMQPPEFNREKTSLSLTVDKSGAAKGTMTVEAVGRTGSLLRRVARNEELLNQGMQRMATAFLPNASSSNAAAIEVKSLRTPASLKVDVEARTFARSEGDTLRMRIPSDWNPRTLFTLSNRRHPLVLGTPTQIESLISVAVPEGFDVKKLPMASAVELPCLSLKREVSRLGSTVSSLQTFRITCERISATEYTQYRTRVDEMVRLLEDELVLAPTAAAKKPAIAKPK